jgi:hypothetical protein
MGSRDPKGDRKRRAKKAEEEKPAKLSAHSERLRSRSGGSGKGVLMNRAAPAAPATPAKQPSGRSGGSGKGVKVDPGTGARASSTKKTTPAKANGKGGESFGKAFARERAAQGPGGKFDWEGSPYTTDRADDKPKTGNGLASVGAALRDAVKDIGAPTPEATKKIARKYQSSAPGPAGSVGRKRGARQRSKMKSELRASKATPKKKAAATKGADAKAAAKAAPKQAALDSKLGSEGKATGMKGLPLAPGDRGRLNRAPVEEEPKKKRSPGAKGKQAYGMQKKNYAHGGKVRGVGAAKRGFGRGKTV